MNRCRMILTVVFSVVFAIPAPAGIIFHRKPKVNAADQVPQLIVAVKTDPDEKKRAAAAEELRTFDSKMFTDIVPVLIDVAQHDTASGVRMEAMQSLAKIRPISQEAGMALEQAVAQDSSTWVQIQARGLLLQYRLCGYHSPKNGEVSADRVMKTNEPPMVLGNDATIPAEKPARLTGTLLPAKPAKSATLSQPRLIPQAVTSSSAKVPVRVENDGPDLGFPK